MKTMSIRTVIAAYMIHPTTLQKGMVVMVVTSVGVEGVEYDDSEGEPLETGRDSVCASTKKLTGTAVISNVQLRKTVVKSSWMSSRIRAAEMATKMRRES
jgi:hypothetical protein